MDTRLLGRTAVLWLSLGLGTGSLGAWETLGLDPSPPKSAKPSSTKAPTRKSTEAKHRATQLGKIPRTPEGKRIAHGPWTSVGDDENEVVLVSDFQKEPSPFEEEPSPSDVLPPTPPAAPKAAPAQNRPADDPSAIAKPGNGRASYGSGKSGRCCGFCGASGPSVLVITVELFHRSCQKCRCARQKIADVAHFRRDESPKPLAAAEPVTEPTMRRRTLDAITER